MKRRPVSPVSPSDRLAPVALQPRHWRRDETLPPLRVTPPRRGGWTPERAAKVARAYAREHGLDRHAAEAAYRALAHHVDPCPPGQDPRLRRPRLLAPLRARARWTGGADAEAYARDLLDPAHP